MGKKRVHPVAVSLQGGAGLSRRARQLGIRGWMDAQGSEGSIGVQRRGPEHLGKRAAHDAPVELQLPAPFLGMHIAHGHPGIAGIAGENVGDVAGVPFHRHRSAQTRNRQRSVHHRLAAVDVDAQRQARPHQQRQQAPHQPGPYPPHDLSPLVATYCHVRGRTPVIGASLAGQVRIP